jgi:predicted O-methyltransferase YrrM
MNAVLERVYRDRAVVDSRGRRREIFPTALGPERARYLFELVRARRPARTLEIGFAYGLSTLAIAEALRQNGEGHHLVIDPKERTHFDGIGLRHVAEAGLADWITFYEEPAELCLPRFVTEGVRVGFAFDDSDHLFDHVLTEFLFTATLLERGGVVVFDDDPLPGVSRACDFIATNRPDFTEIGREPVARGLRALFRVAPAPPPPKGMRAFQKVAAEDPRGWKDFTPF